MIGTPGSVAAPGAPESATTTADAPAFAHRSEAELARILDFYEVRWEYEPHVYPILFALDGTVQESFAPDFYLPDLDLYVELTTLRQRLVRKKNRKLRRLRELYPGIRIKLFYERDFRALMLKYGKLAIADELSGTVGQVGAPPGVAPETAVAAPEPAAVATGRPRLAPATPPTVIGDAGGRSTTTRRSTRTREATTR